MEQNIFNLLPGAVLPWYDENKRDLPWRRDRQPYHIWLSEIMLQQTRVEAVKGYYARFLESCPDILALASADDERLHKLWEGLGYYNRVRNLKKAAIQIMEQYGGRFPGEYEKVLALPGIGEYTAGAICSIAFDQPKAAVDGNVLRVAARLTDDDTPVDLAEYKSSVKQALEAVYPARAGDFTQALMELGATVCLPNGKPLCEECPCASFCRGRMAGRQEQLPVRLPKRGKRTEDMTILILRSGSLFALQKRPDAGLLAGLWEFPNVSGSLTPQQVVDKVGQMGIKVRQIMRCVEKKHIFTHIQWNMRGYYMEIEEPAGELTWMDREKIESSAALPTAFRQFWEDKDDV